MKKFSKVIALILCFALVACFAACAGNKPAGNDNESNAAGENTDKTDKTDKGYTSGNTVFKIGLSGPLTGGAAIYGVAVKNAAQMAVDEINAAGGLNGVLFELTAMDDQHDATKVATNYSALFEAGMQASLGCVTTNPCLEWKNLSLEDNVFFLTPSASADAVPTNENGYQMCFADSKQGISAANYVAENFAGETIGVFFKSDDAYSTGIYDNFKNTIGDKVTIVEASFTDANATDFASQIESLKDCKFIFMPIYYTPASTFMLQAKGIIADDAIYYGCDGFDGIDSIEGFDIATIPQEVSMLSHFNSKAEDGAAKEFIDKYSEAYGTDTLNQFGAAAYDCVYAIYSAMKAAVEAGTEIDVTISASDLCEILKAQFDGSFTYSGVTGTDMTWDETGYVQKAAVKYIVKSAD